jgi:hypothetical protein
VNIHSGQADEGKVIEVYGKEVLSRAERVEISGKNGALMQASKAPGSTHHK